MYPLSFYMISLMMNKHSNKKGFFFCVTYCFCINLLIFLLPVFRGRGSHILLKFEAFYS